MAAKQLFGGRQKVEDPSIEILESGDVLFPSQKKIYGQMDHVIGVHKKSNAEIRPHFHLTGDSGSGKSFLTKMIAKQYKVPFIEVNAAGLTSEGLSGNSLSKALRQLREHWNQPNIIFVDEFDKLFQRNGETTEGFRSAVQDEFLTSLEGKYTSVFTDYGKYEPVVVENSLFIFAGAYSNQKITTMQEMKETGLRTEFMGRVPLVFSTDQVTIPELEAAIPSIALFQSYRKLMGNQAQNKDVAGVLKIIKVQSEEMNIGIRLLNSAIHQHFMRNV